MRVQHASALYLHTVICQSEWMQRHRDDLHLAAALAAAPADLRQRFDGNKSAELLALPKRPASSLSASTMAWAVPLAQIRRAVEAAMASKEPQDLESPDFAWWGGYTWRAFMQVHQPEPGKFKVAACLNPHAPPGSCTRGVFTSVDVKISTGRAEWSRTYKFEHCGGKGYADAFGMGAITAWDEAAWHAAGVVTGNKVELRFHLRTVT